nr:PREDICTED: metabotropic glutamate receptor 2-like isoform X1 [Bemisia tabaci]XP_018899864.1 PREDICTED: metabotropic glutamate receptor 2-like isoform X1 [Bemisia tabaci]
MSFAFFGVLLVLNIPRLPDCGCFNVTSPDDLFTTNDLFSTSMAPRSTSESSAEQLSPTELRDAHKRNINSNKRKPFRRKMTEAGDLPGSATETCCSSYTVDQAASSSTLNPSGRPLANKFSNESLSTVASSVETTPLQDTGQEPKYNEAEFHPAERQNLRTTLPTLVDSQLEFEQDAVTPKYQSLENQVTDSGTNSIGHISTKRLSDGHDSVLGSKRKRTNESPSSEVNSLEIRETDSISTFNAGHVSTKALSDKYDIVSGSKENTNRNLPMGSLSDESQSSAVNSLKNRETDSISTLNVGHISSKTSSDVFGSKKDGTNGHPMDLSLSDKSQLSTVNILKNRETDSVSSFNAGHISKKALSGVFGSESKRKNGISMDLQLSDESQLSAVASPKNQETDSIHTFNIGQISTVALSDEYDSSKTLSDEYGSLKMLSDEYDSSKTLSDAFESGSKRKNGISMDLLLSDESQSSAVNSLKNRETDSIPSFNIGQISTVASSDEYDSSKTLSDVLGSKRKRTHGNPMDLSLSDESQLSAVASPKNQETDSIHTFNIGQISTVALSDEYDSSKTLSDEYDSSKTLSDVLGSKRKRTSGTPSMDLPLSDESRKKSRSSAAEELQWPVKRSAEIPGDLILGGLMMVHEREDSRACGPVMPQGGVQALETMLYTLDRINAETEKFKVTLGAHILDDCDKDTYGLEMALDFIKGSLSNIEDGGYQCNKTQVRKVISGVVGAASSVTSIQVANLLRLFKIPQVSFFSTSPELSNKQRFEYFSRTIPSDEHQVRAMVEVVRKMQWSYVSIIYEESNYGVKAFEELETQLSRYNICIAVKEKLVKDSGVADESAYNEIVNRLLMKPRAKGVIIFGSDQEVAGVMKAVRRLNVTGWFSWVGSDGWSARALVSNGNEKEVEGTLSVQPQANPVKGFEEYFLNLTVENNKRNPWFVEFWEAHFTCRYPNSSLTPYNGNYTRTCTTTEKLTAATTAFEKQLQFVSDAVMAFAHAFKDMHRDLCHNESGLCEAMNPSAGPELLKYLRNVSFIGLSGDHFRFDSNGDGPARYNIIHYKRTSDTVYEWVKVGEYIDGELDLNMSEIRFSNGQSGVPESVCSLPCELGEAKKYVERESCCWHCFNCSQYQIRSPTDETQCMTCPEGHKPDARRESCLEIPAVYLTPSNGWAIGAMSFSAFGILFTLFNFYVFLRYNDTPVVKAAGRELSYVLLTGILLCYSITFLLIIKPTDLVCSIQRFGVGFCFTIVYSALLTKTNRISRIFNAGKRTAKRPGYITPQSQLIICSVMCSVQILINVVWMMISPARAIHHYPSRETNILVCSSFTNASYMIAFSYPIALVMVCTVYAVLTRNIPEAFNESKHIGFTMYTTCVIWLAFIPLYFGTGNHTPLRITTMSIAISLSASVTVVCLFSPKLYIILWRPDQNVRQSMMPSRYSGTVKTGTTAGAMAAAVAVSNANPPYAQTNNSMSSVVDIEMKSDFAKRNSVPMPHANLISKGVQTESQPSPNISPTSQESVVNKSSLSGASRLSTTVQLNNNNSIPDRNKTTISDNIDSASNKSEFNHSSNVPPSLQNNSLNKAKVSCDAPVSGGKNCVAPTLADHNNVSSSNSPPSG